MFIKLIRDVIDGRLVRLNGFVVDIDLPSQSFALCRIHRPLAWVVALRRHAAMPGSIDDRIESSGRPDIDDGGDMDDDTHPRRRCIDVNLTNGASIFDTDGTPIRLGDVNEGERATVVGKIPPDAGPPPRDVRLPHADGARPGTFEHRVGLGERQLRPGHGAVRALAPLGATAT